jgi:signal peptidase I
MYDKKTCILVRELLPLYQDDCISKDCQEAVSNHLAECEECSEHLKQIKTDVELSDKQERMNNDNNNESEEELITETLQYQKVGKRLKRKRIQIVLSTIAACVLVLIVFHTLFINSKIVSSSMEPTFQVNDNLLFSKAAYWFSSPERDDIVIINHHKEYYSMVKRVVGIPGDIIQIKQGKLYINGDIYETSGYVADLDMGEEGQTVLQGEYFVIGDNVENSLDSRVDEFGCVKESSIVAKYLFTIPFSNPFVETKIAQATTAEQ